MRWSGQTVEAIEQARLPGYREGAVVRHFDAPEAMDIRFYEVHAKSALNRVPEASQVPFRWTINPYRGCTHACVYCLAGDTPILMADGRTRRLAELRPGDRIIGTEMRGRHRRLVPTEVLDHWSTIKRAYRVTLEDGTELIASGDHRFLTDRGWKHVVDDPSGQRPHLTTNDRLIGPGRFSPGPIVDDEYRRGYVCGIVRGDGSIGSYEHERPSGRPSAAHRFRLALCDGDALERAQQYLSALGVETDRFLFHEGTANTRRSHAVRTQRRDAVERILDGRALKAPPRLGVKAVTALGVEMPLYDITTGTGDFIANGVVSHNCFARPTHTYLDLDAGRDFEREIVVKVNVPEVLRAELRRPSWKGEHVAMGTNTDPYQWVEGRYRLMPGIWEALRDARNPCSVLTKSPLLLRDLDLLREVAAVTDVSAAFSVPTLDEKAWRASEPHTPHPRARLEAVGELNRAGIPCSILVAPLMPGINDSPAQVERILELAAENGATAVTGIALHLRGEVRQVFMDWLRAYRPDLVPRYERLYARGAYAPQAERERLTGLVRAARSARPFRSPRPAPPPPRPREPAPVQEALF